MASPHGSIHHKAVQKRSSRPKPTSLYVRLCVPDDLVEEVNSPKPLTTRIAKFGISWDVDERDINYVYGHGCNGHDNGYMAFSFECHSREEAIIVERIMKVEFKDLTVYDSYEYVDAAGAAARLGIEYEPTYEGYLAIGRQLFIHMIETLKMVFPGKYLGRYGNVHDLRRTGSKKMTGTCHAITSDIAIEYGFRTPSTSWAALTSDNLEPVPDKQSAVSWRDVPFDKIPVFAKMEDSEEMYRAVPHESDAREIAGKVLHDYATKMWKIPAEKIDEVFHEEHVKAPDALSSYFRTIRFVAAITKTSDVDIRFSNENEAYAAYKRLVYIQMCDHVLEYKRGNRFYLFVDPDPAIMFTVSQRFLNRIADSAAATALASNQTISVQEEACATAYKDVLQSMSSQEIARFSKLFSFKGSTGCVVAKKILGDCFGMEVVRRDPKSDRRHYHTILLSQPTLKLMTETFGSDLRRPLVSGKPLFKGKMAIT